MIRLFTGLPGAGKTTHFVDEAMRFVAEGRPVYVANLNGCSIPGVEILDDPRTWPDLPDGSVVMVDEAQKFWRGGRSGEATPEILELETHRHRGFDFLLTTQQPTYLHAHLRKLVGEHTHHVQRTKGIAQTWTWARCADDPVSNSEQEAAEGGLYKYNPQAFNYYTSTVKDTHKPKMGWRMKFMIGGGVLLLLAIIFGPGLLKKFTLQTGADASAKVTGDGASAQPSHRPGTSAQPVTVEGWLQKHAPRVAAAPWSAPGWDARPVVSEPELYCISSEAGRDGNGEWKPAGATCLTEQGTAYRIDKATAKLLARQGPMYNPYRDPKKRNEMQVMPKWQRGVGQSPTDMPAIAGASVRAGIGYGEVAQYGGIGVGVDAAPR